jgi:hypothetical protein
MLLIAALVIPQTLAAAVQASAPTDSAVPAADGEQVSDAENGLENAGGGGRKI